MDKNVLHKYFKGETLPEEEQRIMDWAEASPENYQALLRERRLWNATLLSYSLDQTQTATRSRFSFNLWQATSIAATIALLISLSWNYLRSGSVDTDEWQRVFVPVGQRVQLNLADGTKIWLNSNTTFTYPASFGADTREVELNGEGYFEVAKNAEKPFIVQTKDYAIRVLGTTFNVYAYADGMDRFETSLLKGAVTVSSRTEPGESIRLRPNDRVVISEGKLMRQPVTDEERFRWIDGYLCLDDVPFAELVKRLSTYYDTPITIENQQVLSYRCTGKFRQIDGLDHALRVLQKDVRFTYERNYMDNHIIIK